MISLEWDGQNAYYQRVSIKLDRFRSTATSDAPAARSASDPTACSEWFRRMPKKAGSYKIRKTIQNGALFLPSLLHSHFVGLHRSLFLSGSIARLHLERCLAFPTDVFLTSDKVRPCTVQPTYISHQHLRGSVPTSPRFIATHFLRLFNHYEQPPSECSSKIHRRSPTFFPPVPPICHHNNPSRARQAPGTSPLPPPLPPAEAPPSPAPTCSKYD